MAREHSADRALRNCLRYCLMVLAIGVMLAHAFRPSAFGQSGSTEGRIAKSCGSRWLTPVKVLPSQMAPVLRFPNVALAGRQTFVVGNTIASFDDQRVPARPLAVAAAGDRLLGTPSGNFFFVTPKAVVDQQGRLHVIWAEPPRGGPATFAPSAWPPRPLADLWAASYDAKSGWTDPKKIYEGTDIDWSSGSVANSPSGNAMVIVATDREFGRRGNSTVLFLQLRSVDWEVTRLETEDRIAYASLAVRGRRWLLGYVAPAMSVQNNGTGVSFAADRNSVFVVESTNGTNWASPALVSRSGESAAFAVQALWDNAGRAHLVWRRTVGGSGVLQHAERIDSNWMPPDGMTVPLGSFVVRATIDRCNAIHVVSEDASRGEDGFQLVYARWDRKWSALERPFPEGINGDPYLVTGSNGRTVLAYLARARKPASDTALHTMITQLAP